MNRNTIFNLFDDQLEIKADQIESRQLLLQKKFEHVSTIIISDQERRLLKDFLGHSPDNTDLRWFYFQLHDNLIKELVCYQKENEKLNFLDQSTRLFKEHPANEGGNSLTGLLDAASQSLLTIHCNTTDNELTMTEIQLKRET